MKLASSLPNPIIKLSQPDAIFHDNAYQAEADWGKLKPQGLVRIF